MNTDIIYQIIKWATIIICEIVPIVGSVFIQRKQAVSGILLGLVTMMTSMFVGMMLLAAFAQYESREYLGTFISPVIALFAMSMPFWVPRLLDRDNAR